MLLHHHLRDKNNKRVTGYFIKRLNFKRFRKIIQYKYRSDMYPDLCNMKSFSIAFLPLTSVTVLSQGFQTLPFHFMGYALTSCTCFSRKGILFSIQQSANNYFKDITLYLTKPSQSILPVMSHRIKTSFTKMWTTTTTIVSNKKQYVTLVTTLNKFGIQTTSVRPVNTWYKSDEQLRLEKNQKKK